ncbi:hypothetical protein CANARDRAFT_201130 [[Candida] arabinofermentans NRRL YB-2248]|uniref:C2H2-type domain-containing protein n=1 Tax=[Candida] arabinofermentans NRRL YB-2248 TaxID=983967 RepID=A0A1E4SXU6_9ASCO|nr:hypothetical protein CANARDRAFT_201130 [[Candida] arabinofermentans NRRL YB-2248]
MAIPNANNGDSSQPINISFSRGNSFYQNPRLRRESIAHSQGMGGISWGSVTIGSWLKDEVMLHNQQQQQQNHGNNNANHFSPFMNSNKDTQNIASISPALNNSSYLADLEANYCKDYSCCGQLLPTLHDLLRHYEEMHIQQESTLEAPRARPINNAMGTVSTNEVFLTPQSSQQQTQPTIRSNATTNNNSLNQINSGLLQHQIPNNQNNLNSTLNNFTFNQSNGSQQQQQQNQSNMEDDEEVCIDDPSRRLYVMEQGENRPFKCPVIGCDKNYKNQNGLKYHRLHGHQNQTLRANPDGTYSVIDPESDAPYPDGMGMEKDKPYRCEVCGKRYKNLNGLKYHRGHSTH